MGILGRPRCRWEGNIKIDHKRLRWEVVDWICMIDDKDRLRAIVNTKINTRYTYLKGWEYLEDVDVDGKIILKWIIKH